MLLAGCATVSLAGDLPSGDTKHWKTYRVEVGDQVVQFTIPLGESSDWPVVEIPRRIDLGQPRVFNQTGEGPKLLARFWDYRASRFANVDGTLRAYIVLWQSELELRDSAALQAASEESSVLVKAKEIMSGGKGGPRDTKRYEP